MNSESQQIILCLHLKMSTNCLCKFELSNLYFIINSFNSLSFFNIEHIDCKLVFFKLDKKLIFLCAILNSSGNWPMKYIHWYAIDLSNVRKILKYAWHKVFSKLSINDFFHTMHSLAYNKIGTHVNYKQSFN